MWLEAIEAHSQNMLENISSRIKAKEKQINSEFINILHLVFTLRIVILTVKFVIKWDEMLNKSIFLCRL